MTSAMTDASTTEITQPAVNATSQITAASSGWWKIDRG